MSEANYRFARNFKNEFDPSVSWADPIVIQRLPLHTVDTRSYLAEILHEATCERTFSYTGRIKTKLRSSLIPDMVCASAICVAGEGIKKMSIEEIMAQYQSKRKLEDEGAAEMRLLNLPLRRRSNGGLSVSCKSISPFPLFSHLPPQGAVLTLELRPRTSEVPVSGLSFCI